jgi:hypothetical protein
MLAAYVYVLADTVLLRAPVALNRDGSLSIPGALLWSCWNVVWSLWLTVPLGAILGFGVPRLAAHWSRREAIYKGGLLGFGLGFLGGVFLAAWFHLGFSPQSVTLCTTMACYTSIWVVIFSRMYAGRLS